MTVDTAGKGGQGWDLGETSVALNPTAVIYCLGDLEKSASFPESAL